MEPRVDLDQICSELPGLTCSRVNLWRGLRNEATEGHATLTAGACVRASAQWLITNGKLGTVPAGRIRQARPHFGRSRRSLFKTFSRRMKHSVAWIERSETQDACRLGETVPGFAPLSPVPASRVAFPGMLS